ncbi:MAG TPA: dienelactone hydrolase family protein [Chryseosolibacter sp.]
MKHFILAVAVCLSLTNWSCKDEAEDIIPSTAAQPKRDSTAVVTSVAEPEVVTDSTSTTPAPIAKKRSGLDFRDSAYYQPAKFNAMPYRVMVPTKYDSTKQYPLVVFLHGIDERGSDNEKQLRWGASLFKSDSVRKDYPAFVIFPQCPADYYWANENPMEALKDLIDDFVLANNVNQNKIYIVGLSMGAYGTYEMVARNPGMFAAAIAISGDGDHNRAKNMAKSAWKIYAGGKDNIVTSDKSERMAQALRKSGAKVSLTVYPHANHVGSWVNAFEEPDFCSWLFSISRQ